MFREEQERQELYLKERFKKAEELFRPILDQINTFYLKGEGKIVMTTPTRIASLDPQLSLRWDEKRTRHGAEGEAIGLALSEKDTVVVYAGMHRRNERNPILLSSTDWAEKAGELLVKMIEKDLTKWSQGYNRKR